MSLTDDAYSRLSQEERDKYDSEVLAKEKLEQEALPYKWTQTLDHVEMMIPVPSGTRSKQVQLTLKRTSISVTVHGSIIVEGALPKPILTDDSTWTIGTFSIFKKAYAEDDGSLLSIYLEKENQNEWWPHVVTHHPKIDTRKIKPEDSSLSDLDGETRAMVEKMMQMGLPTSDQLQQQEMLAKFTQS
ncbi:hypothetical protein Malapachy_0018 [Malassezia pachydermatis]|uniref:Nuclear movement protein nudC n=1 Tax=Malassezia pachydermatis TaxID=77020 RepID=A0A0M8MKN4_9BASI|nr:hypothetical protein Malapachy_0018 [Malassezia pachydermatis]KOS13468.1 hypothetical protein Malapachy_0018 [Malassezia pachydermatis]